MKNIPIYRYCINYKKMFPEYIHFDNWKSVAMKKACLLFVQEVLAILYRGLLENWTRLFGHAVPQHKFCHNKKCWLTEIK